MLEQRIAALTSTLESRAAAGRRRNIRNISKARCARCPSGSTACRSATTTRRPLPISNSACPICWSAWKLPATDPPRPPSISAGSRKGCTTSCAQLERQHASLVALADNNRNAGAPQPMDTGIVDLVKREMSDIRFSQSETDRRTQDSLETVHSTLGHVVDRLSMIEGDLRTVRAAPAAPRRSSQMPPASNAARSCRARRAAQACAAAAEAGIAESRRAARPVSHEHFAAAPREFQAAQPPAAGRPAVPPRAISEILEPHAARRAPRSRRNCRRIIRSSRAPGPPRRRVVAVGADRRFRKRDQRDCRRRRRSRSARRASLPPRAAPRRPPPPRRLPRRPATAAKAAPQGQGCDKAKVGKADDKEPSTITSKIRSLLVGASVVVIVLGTFKMAMTLLDTGSRAADAGDGESSEPAPRGASRPPESSARPAPRQRRAGALDDLADADRRQSNNSLRAEHAGQRAAVADPAGAGDARRTRRLAGTATTSPARFRRPPAAPAAASSP